MKLFQIQIRDPLSKLDFKAGTHTQIVMLFEALEARKNYSPERFERTLRCLIFHSEGT